MTHDPKDPPRRYANINCFKIADRLVRYMDEAGFIGNAACWEHDNMRGIAGKLRDAIMDEFAHGVSGEEDCES